MRTAASLVAVLLCAAPFAARAQALKTDEDKTLYALGSILGGNVKTLGLTKEELVKVKQGFDDAAAGKKLLLEMSEWGPKVSAFAQKRQADNAGKEASKEKEASKAFLEKAGAEAGAEKLPSGLIFKTIKAGTGKQPAAADTVKVHYEGKLTSGEIFDSSKKRGQPTTFPLNGVIKCWTEGVGKMKEGEVAQLVCPSDIAYGDRGRPPSIPGGATLVFEVELISIEAPPAPPPATPAAPAKADAKPATPAAPAAPATPPAPAAKQGCSELGAASLIEALSGAAALLFFRRRSRRA
jgi:FKBP-type peptidyl-prolyl cis-trans isomerase FkpA